MKLKSILTTALLVFVGVSIAFMLWKNTAEKGQASDVEEYGEGHVVVAYYFHGNARCETCRKIESYTADTVTNSLADYISSDALVFEIVNVDEPRNEHFVSDYELSTRSVVLVNIVDSQQTAWKNLEKVWDVVDDKAAFQQYIEEETLAYLKGE
ncbi:MAG: nitrophenyl compound nitroreductase subunit ArsF family protein [Kiritimatiellia bacterium]|jgi:hypothetical protein|nr:nitrophenyl compound nitroreductase subunit ArsF family protein [Kiritimatiellia bacterium]MDP6847331.1 nitrophenyl compound nitroreductase subunit ArsF family protein [Kiritimatiellia bacterium]